MPDGGFNFLDSSPNIGVYSGDLKDIGVGVLSCLGFAFIMYLLSKIK